MRGIEKIAAQIIGEAEEKKAAIYEEIQHKIDELNAKTDEEIKAELERINEDTLREEGTLEELAGLAAQQKRRQAALSAKQEVIGEIINEAYERLLNLEDEKYFAVIKKMLEDNVLSEKGEIIFSARDRQRMPKDFEDVIKNVAFEKGNIRGGSTAPPGPSQAGKQRFFREATGHMVCNAKRSNGKCSGVAVWTRRSSRTSCPPEAERKRRE